MKHKAITVALLACAAHLFSTAYAPAATQTDITGPAGSGQFGKAVTALPNGNIVVIDPLYDAPGPIADVGAVYLYSPAGELISMLTGSTANDKVGVNEIVVLANGNFVVRSPNWSNGGASEAGAATWCSGATGCSGTVSPANSLVGSTAGDAIGRDVTALPNGHYVALGYAWDNGGVKNAGAATWCDGTRGCTGPVTSANSLVGSTEGDEVGLNGAQPLANGNYVIVAPTWDNGAVVDAGAGTWCDGTSGCAGAISTANSLYGTTTNDRVGVGRVASLTNGNYVVRNHLWSNGAIAGAGAATWCNGASGCTGPVSPSNSLVGTQMNDEVATSVAVLKNGNYVVGSPRWDNGSIENVGAVTWGDGATGRTGEVSPANSLIGSTTGDSVGGAGAAALANGNYVVNSPQWNHGGKAAVGASTWCNGTSGCTGVVSASNSLVGSNADDRVGTATTALTSGHYVVRSPLWNSGTITAAGAATWGNGSSGRTGVVSAANSLVGTTSDERVGSLVAALTNGHYVVGTQDWDNGPFVQAGAATWCNGAEGCVGVVSAANSLVGSTTGDLVSGSGIVPLANGNYVVASRDWASPNRGAVTWCSGAAGCTGTVSPANSVVGSTTADEVGFATATKDGNYFFLAPRWDNGTATDVGAITLGRGNVGVVGTINAENSVLGGMIAGGPALRATYSELAGQLIVGRAAENIVSLFTYRGATFTVTTTDDHDDGACSPDDCTLREAIIAANAAADDNSIAFAPGLSGTIQLGGALPSLTSNIVVRGPGADVLTVRRNSVGLYRIFTITNSTANGPDITIEGLTIRDGQAPSIAFPLNSGGGILNDRGTVTVRNCKILGNSSDISDFNAGGGIFNFEGSLIIEGSTVAENIATNGGGVGNVRRTSGTASLVVRDSTITGNTAGDGNGGGVYSDATGNETAVKLSILNSTLSGNTATAAGVFGGSGGAIYNFGSTSGVAEMFVQDCTISGNNAPNAGGIYNHSFSASATLRLQNTILKTGATGSNFINSSGAIISLGNNLVNDDAGSGTTGTGPGGFLNTSGDIRNTDPLLGPLADNGGPTLTHALLNGSPAINAGETSGVSNFDQRGFKREGVNDIGAFEFAGNLPPPTPTPTPDATPQPSATPDPAATPSPTATAIPTATPTPNRFANISTRLRVETGDNVLIGGFIVTGSEPKKIIVRALGPSLPAEVGPLANPLLELFDGNGDLVAANDNWQEAANAHEIVGSTIPPSNDLESAILRDVAPGAYTAVVRDVADGEGVGLVEVYDLGSNQDSKLANIATRGRVLIGDNVMIGGLIITGSSPQKVIVRAIGPSLNVGGRLEDPVLELYDGNGVLLQANDNWRTDQEAQIEATTIPPANDLESAIVATLSAAPYTALVRGAVDGTGIALVEVYALD